MAKKSEQKDSDVLRILDMLKKSGPMKTAETFVDEEDEEDGMEMPFNNSRPSNPKNLY